MSKREAGNAADQDSIHETVNIDNFLRNFQMPSLEGRQRTEGMT